MQIHLKEANFPSRQSRPLQKSSVTLLNDATGAGVLIVAHQEGGKKQPCPGYEQKIGCWELDWKLLLEKAPIEQKEMMGKWVEENCPKCPVYVKHQTEIDAKISALAQG